MQVYDLLVCGCMSVCVCVWMNVCRDLSYLCIFHVHMYV